jgi:hypothetical protein
MAPTGLALIFGGLIALALGLAREFFPPKWGSAWPGLEPRWHDRVPALWCYWLGVALIVVGILMVILSGPSGS